MARQAVERFSHVRLVTAATNPSWRILLPDSMRQRALDCVLAIAEDLCSQPASARSGIEAIWDNSLGYGSAGLALFFHYLHLSGISPTAIEWRDRFMAASTQAVAARRMPSDLHRGYMGIAWSWKHIHGDGDPQKRAAAWLEIDHALRLWMQRANTPCELFEGIGGLCLYIAEFANPSDQEFFELALDKLELEALTVPNGVTFPMSTKMRQHWISDFGQEPTDIWKISVAHGNAGCLGALAAALMFESSFERGAALLTKGCEWIWSHQSNGSRVFPEMVGAELPCLTSGWCNGDLGIAHAMLQIARRLGRPDWQQRSLAIARSEAAFRIDKVEENNRRNYCLCHGHAGRAHIFNRLYQSTGEELFAEASIYWFEQCLALRTCGSGFGGFLLYEGFDREVKSTRGFLMGAGGLGLALLAAATEVSPEWDRLLLASFRQI